MEATTATAEGRREQILAAAREVLAEHGYERTTVSRIAQRAQVAQGTFYLYFPSKEALPGVLGEELSQALGEATDRAAEADTLPEAVDALLRESHRAGEDFADILAIANRGLELATDYEEFKRLTAPWRERLEAFLRRYQATGEIDGEIDVESTACVLRDLIDRAMKAMVMYQQPEYAEATAVVVRRALAC